MKELKRTFGLRLALMLGGVATPSLKREEGQTFVEYALILSVIAVGVTVALTFLRNQVTTIFSNIGNSL